MKHFEWLLHFGANYVEQAAKFHGRCSFCLIAKKQQKQNESHFPTWFFFNILAQKSPFLVTYIMSAYGS